MSGRSTSTHGAVTPQGIRDAEPLVLALLVERRAGRVLAYGDEVARPDLALQAASEAFAAFRIAVATADQADALDPEAALLHATREAAARHAENPYRPSGRERPERRTTACELMPRLLVAWTEGRLSVEDEQRLVRHLRRCPDCRALKDAFARAEERYRGGSGATLDSTETSVIVSTMAAVQIPVAGAAPAPEPTAAEGAAPAPDASPEPPVAADAADLADVPEPSAEQPHAAPAEHPIGDVEEPPVEPQAPVAAPAADPAAPDGVAPETAADAPPADSDDGDDPAWSDSDTWEDEFDADPVPLDDPWEEEPHDEAVPEPAAAPSAEWDEIVLSPSDPLGPEAMGYVVPQPGLPRPTARTRRGLRRRRPLPRRDPAAARRADQARHVPDVAVPPPVEAAAAEPVSFEPPPVAEPLAAEPSPVEPPLAAEPPLAEPSPVEPSPVDAEPVAPSPVEAEPVAAQRAEEPPVEEAAAVEPPSNADVEPPVEPEPDVPATDVAAVPAAAEPPHEVATVEPAPAAPLPVPIAAAPPSDAVPAAPSPPHDEPPPAREPDVAHDAVQPPSYAAVPAPEPASAEPLHADPHPQPEQPTTVLPATITAGGAPPATAAPRSHGVVATVVRQLGIPAVLLVIVLLAALAAAGVFSSDDQTPTPTSPARQTVPTDPSQLPPLEMPR